jgi:hypothetical protein
MTTARHDVEPDVRIASDVKTDADAAVSFSRFKKNIFFLFFGTPSDVASAQRTLKKRF